MNSRTVATYTLDLVIDQEEQITGAQLQEIERALDNLTLGYQLEQAARGLLAQRGGPLAGVKVINRHDA